MAPLTRGRKKALATAPPAPVEVDPADRISQLPKEIRAQILSFVPAQEAVRTCVLARTWCNVWKSTRCLLITGREHVLVKEVRGFVDRLIRLRLDGIGPRSSTDVDDDDYTPIDACEIVFTWGYYDVDNDDDEIENIRAVGRWIPLVLECQVKSLRVNIWLDHGHIPMRDKPLVSQHLTRLELTGLWFFEGHGYGWLDLSGCPGLEHLKIIDCQLDDVSEVTSPSVKRLVITGCLSSSSQRIQISFPLVVSLRLDNFYDKAIVLESMPQLEEAYVSIEENPEYNFDDDDEDITNSECFVLDGLAEAKHLVLLGDDNMVTFTRDLRFCPTFSKLKTLVLNDNYWCESADCSALACMLQHAPVLEKLTVLFSGMVKSEYNTVVEVRPPATGNSIMISQHLKIIELKYSEVNERVVKFQIFLGTLNMRYYVRVTKGSK